MDGETRLGADVNTVTGRKSVLVVGASSLVGRRLCELLRSPGLITRYDAQFTSRWRTTCKTLCLDLSRPQSFNPSQTFDAAFICSPIWLLSEAAILRFKALGVRRMVVFSSTSRYTKTHSPLAEERKVVDGLIEGEARVAAVCAREGIGFTILRPTLIYDEGRDQNISKILKVIDKVGVFAVCGKARGLRQPVHARDLALAAVQALESPSAANKAYNLSGGETLSYRDMVRRIFAARDMRPKIIAMPGFVWRTAFGVINLLRPKHKLKLNVEMALRMNTDLAFEHDDATRDFGYAPKPFVLDGLAPRENLFDCPMSKGAVEDVKAVAAH
jgi:uncharacterized protein YbjT (DUF2867 family)